jgi:hypothetical protein
MTLSNRHAYMSVALIVAILGFCTAAPGVEFAGGDGTMGNPYQIATARQLLDIGSNPQLMNLCFVLNNDIDFDSHYGPEGHILQGVIAPHSYGSAFEGWLDGRGHVIRHLRIKADFGKPFGFIGQVGAKGTILSLGVEDSVIDGAGDCVGLLAGSSSGTILGCWAKGQVKGQNDVGLLVGLQQGGTISYGHSEGSTDGRQAVGGLIGRVTAGEVLECSSDCRRENAQAMISYCGGLVGRLAEGTIEDSFARVSLVAPQSNGLAGLVGFNEAGVIRACLALGTISGSSSSAGLVGMNSGTIRSCYSLCRVEASRSAGGLVCDNGGTILLCYAVGVVKAPGAGGLVAQGHGAFLSYWDVEKSGVTTSAGGFGRTTAQMRQAATFRGWGRESEWFLPEGDTPCLWWEPAWGAALVDPAAQFPAGSGTEDDPYQIQTAAEFASLAWDAGLLDKHFALTRDVNLAELDSDALLPIGTRGLPFCGSLDGRGHVLSGFACDLSVNYAGLFGCVGPSLDDPNRTGCVKDLVVRDAQVAGGDIAGALTASLDGGRIERCFVTGEVQGSSIVGGAIGEVTAGEVMESAFEGHVSGRDTVGGLVGSHQGILRSCYSAGEVVGEKYYIGGLVGKLGDISGGASLPLIAFCYSQAQVKGDSSVGGLLGSADQAEVFACFSAGKVQGSRMAGGLAGAVRGVVTWGSVWDRQSAAISDSALGQAQTTAAMKDPRTYAGWEYGHQWTLKAGTDYPRLIWEDRAGPLLVDPARSYGGGAGTRSNPYLVSQGEHLVTLSRYPQDFGRHFRLTKDVDLQGTEASLSPIGTLSVPFTGSFDGNYHTLRNLKFADATAAYVGLFRSIERDSDADGAMSGLISNLHLKGASVTAAQYVGALAARNNGEILFCTVSESTITADDYVGGLIGHNGADGAVLACESGAAVMLGGVVQPNRGFENAGGLVALNEGGLLLCSSSGQVRGRRESGTSYEPMRSSVNLGGLVGVNRGMVTGCTSTSPVSGSSHVGGLAGFNEGGSLYRCGAVTDADTIDYGGAFVAQSVGGTITGCFARGKVKGTSVAGFIGSSRDDAIEACYFQGSVSGRNLAGFIGEAYGQSQLRDCYCATEILGVPYSCAFARSLSASVQLSGCFWDNTVFPDSRNMQSLPASAKAGVTGLDTESLQSGQKLRDAGWDFAGTWVQCDGHYPRLWWEATACDE